MRRGRTDGREVPSYFSVPCVVFFPKAKRVGRSLIQSLSLPVPLTGCQVGAFFLVYPDTHCDALTFLNVKYHSNQTIDMSRLTSLIHNITLLQFIAIITKLPGKAMPEWSAYRGSTTVEEFHVLDVPTVYCILVVSRVIMNHKHTIHQNKFGLQLILICESGNSTSEEKC